MLSVGSTNSKEDISALPNKAYWDEGPWWNFRRVWTRVHLSNKQGAIWPRKVLMKAM